MESIIYGIKNPKDNSFFYVGLTKSLEQRIYQHCKSTKSVGLKIKEIQDKGLKPEFVILDLSEDEGSAFQLEQFWINKFFTEGHPILNKRVAIRLKNKAERKYKVIQFSGIDHMTALEREKWLEI